MRSFANTYFLVGTTTLACLISLHLVHEAQGRVLELGTNYYHSGLLLESLPRGGNPPSSPNPRTHVPNPTSSAAATASAIGQRNFAGRRRHPPPPRPQENSDANLLYRFGSSAAGRKWLELAICMRHIHCHMY